MKPAVSLTAAAVLAVTGVYLSGYLAPLAFGWRLWAAAWTPDPATVEADVIG